MELKGPALGTYITATYPSREGFVRALKCLTEASDFIEVGIPTLNPKYDGPVIRMTHRSSELKGLDAVKVAKYGQVPTILMGYVEDYLSELDKVSETAVEVGAQSILYPDLLFEHIELLDRYVGSMRDYGLRPTFFVSSNTPHRIIASLVKYEPLFIYLGLYAATGIKLPLYIERNVKEVRRLTEGVTLVAGFAINSPEMVRLVIGAGADAVVVGSALVDKLNDYSRCLQFIRMLRGGLG